MSLRRAGNNDHVRGALDQRRAEHRPDSGGGESCPRQPFSRQRPRGDRPRGDRR